jgi:hypothetical protein
MGGGFGYITSINKFSFSDSSRTILASGLSAGRQGLASFASSSAGYALSGFTGSRVSTVDKITFATDSVSGLAANGIQGEASAGVESSTHGYQSGGNLPSASNAIRKLTFATDSMSGISTTLSTARSGHASFASTTAGYFLGGSNGPSNTSTIDKISFSSDSRSTLAANLAVARMDGTGMDSTSAGYVLGGDSGNTTVEKILFSTDARSTVTPTITSFNYAVSCSLR